MGALRARQDEILEALKARRIDLFRYATLRSCRPGRCGRSSCCLACAYGAAKAREWHLSASERLLSKEEGPFFEVMVSRSTWSCPLDDIKSLSLNSTRKLFRSGLDKLYMPTISAIGGIKVSYYHESGTARWRVDVNAIVAGASKEELRSAFITSRERHGDFLLVEGVSDIQKTLRRVLSSQLSVWRNPLLPKIDAKRPPKKRRGQYYEWLLNIGLNELVIRYGCDRHFKKLNKQPRRIKPPKPRKVRPDPIWLQRWQFGTESRFWMDLEKQKGKI